MARRVLRSKQAPPAPVPSSAPAAASTAPKRATEPPARRACRCWSHSPGRTRLPTTCYVDELSHITPEQFDGLVQRAVLPTENLILPKHCAWNSGVGSIISFCLLHPASGSKWCQEHQS